MPLRPSMKFPPFISIKIQNAVNIVFTEILLFKIKSIRSTLVLFIFKSKKEIKKITKIICKKNLRLTLLSFFKSENKPSKKIENKKKNNK